MAADASKGGAPGASNPVAIEKFISRWNAASGPERANYQLFLTELCALLGLPRPEPARDETRDNAYVFGAVEKAAAATRRYAHLAGACAPGEWRCNRRGVVQCCQP